MPQPHPLYELIPQGRAIVIRFRHDVFDSDKVLDMHDRLRQMVEDDPEPRVVLDLCNLRFVGSSFLGMLMDVSLKVSHKGGRAGICGMTPQITDLLALTRLNHIIPTFSGVDEAVKSLQA